MSFPMCIGHRGARGYKPENTLPAFDFAIELGCDWLELDVHLVEGELVVIHDRELDRTTNGRGQVNEQSLDYLRSLDAGDGAGIPLLSEVLDLVDQRCGVNVELKGPGTAAPACALLDRYCQKGWSTEQFLVSAFNHRELAQCEPRYRRGALFAKRLEDEWERAASLGAWSVNYDLNDVTETLVDEAHRRGYKILV
ncbi:MAG: glycerophosphodiester phosphodiesterase family protein [Proteobacteria bacterium]|nr:glycerophosphodiester phosphodiesterase family protein [Pseudomonadota bacterium]